jgi:hypothetical protein
MSQPPDAREQAILFLLGFAIMFVALFAFSVVFIH